LVRPLIADEGAMKKRPEILMCSPEHYGIKYVINPWMKLSRPSDPEVSCDQWRNLHAILKTLVEKIHLIRPVPGLPDMVFTANAGLPVGNRVFLSRFRYKQRKPETEHFRRWFMEEGFETFELPDGLFFEGAGDALFLGDSLFAGYRFRSDIESHTYISGKLGIPVLSLELSDKRFYHLDTCFAPLDKNSALYFPEAFDDYGRRVIEQNVPDPAQTARLLETRGFRVHETDLSEFIKAGGSAKCLTLQLS
jgi:N-dimethylarginine dimethylaminohydrolase